MKTKLLSLGLLVTGLVVIAGLPPEQQPKFEPQQPLVPSVPTELEQMHAEHLFHFTLAPGFGLDRSGHLPTRSEITLAGVAYKVGRPDLLALETKAVAYRSFGGVGVSMAMLTNKTLRAWLQTRPISQEESRAIRELRAGKDLVQQAGTLPVPPADGRAPVEVPVIRVIGAMRAAVGCARCHEVPQGTLLGAFSYTLVPANATPQPR